MKKKRKFLFKKKYFSHLHRSKILKFWFFSFSLQFLKKNEIGFSVVRGGNVVGEHSIKYFNGDERLEINHIANDRSIFAKGAIRSAVWLLNQKPGFFTLDHVLT